MKIPRRALAMVLISFVWCIATQAEEVRNAPIHNAAEAGDIGKIKAILNEHPDWVNKKGFNDLTPLDMAVGGGHIDAVVVLLHYGADVNDGVEPSRVHHAGRGTALKFAVWYGRDDIVRLLLDHKADPDVRDSEGWTPLGLAEDRKFVEIATLLRQHGAAIEGEPAIRQWQINDSGRVSAGEVVCKDDTTWSQVWLAFRKDIPRHLKEGQQGVVIFLGQLPTGGYSAEVVSAGAAGAQYIVRYKVTQPHGFVTEALTTPCVLAIVSPNGLPIKFERETP
jgi:hypothetical protein